MGQRDNRMDYPQIFVKNIHNAFGSSGDQWLIDLPDIITLAEQKWNLTIGQPMLLSYNYVTAAVQNDSLPVVLKIGVPQHELISQLTSLEYFDGKGCVQLLEQDIEHGMFLLEKLTPGEMLVSVENDDLRTHIACDVMKILWRSVPENSSLIKLRDWFAGLDGLRPAFSGGTGYFPEELFSRVESLVPALFADSSPPALIHGDLHHFNILSSKRGWVAIDPKGVIGPPEYECGPLLINPIPDFPYLPAAISQTERRIAILGERLGFARERIRDWGLCHAILSAWWDTDVQTGTGGEYSLACAEIIAKAII